MITYTLRIVEIRKETNDTITLCLKQPGLKKIKYQAGQYLTLIFRINGRRYIRPYSFSSSPLTDLTLDITIKRVPNGMVSNHIHDLLKVGDSIEVMSPIGDFVYKPDASKNQLFFWGVGSGITPLISLIKQILAGPLDEKVNLIYGNRDNEKTIFLNLINDLLVKNPKRLKVWNFHTQPSVTQSLPFFVQGRISSSSIVEIMEGVEPHQSLHFICGPLGLKNSVKKVLVKMNVSECDILSEDFELIKNPKDFNDIHTQKVKLKFENNCFDLEVIKGKSILESALDAGIELPYSCQTGSCSTCKGRLIKGEVKMIGLSKKRDDLLSNEYLLCCTHPLSNDIYIEI